jgi:hypothetical protein
MVAVAGGYHHSIALKSDGSVWAWGLNTSGQLGDGTTTDRPVPAQISGLSGVVAVAAGANHSIALKSDGSVWTWGANYYGELGDGTTTGRSSPMQVSGLTGVVAVAGRGDQSLALKSDGSVWAWGYNYHGQLGDGTTTDRYSPTQVPGIAGVVALAAGYFHTVAVKVDGSVWAWGGNYRGQLGDGTTTNRFSPAQVSGLDGVVAVTTAFWHTLALKSDASVWAWGDNSTTELGDGTLAQHLSAVLVVNGNADGYLNLKPGTDFEVPPSVAVPFFVVATGNISDSSASVATTTKFNAPDIGKSGSVYVTAAVPPGSLVAATSAETSLGVSTVGATGAIRSLSSADTVANSFVLIQLTPSGWQSVVNGQLIPYASGVLGDQIAAQTILNTDTTNLKGAQFCLGYGISAEQMIAMGTMRVVATIPDPNATSTSSPSCIVAGPPVSYSLSLPQGWSLLGNSLNQALSVASLYGDPGSVTTVWKWDAASGWQFYTPLMDAATLQSYATAKGYGVLATINPGEGYWVNANASPTLAPQSGTSFALTSVNLAKGWNLAATGIDLTPSAFNANLKASLFGTGVTTLWAWDNTSSRWYFYAPSLEAQGGTALSDYIASKNYLDFTTANKTLGNGTGFWVNR